VRIDDAIRESIANRDQAEASEVCGCYFCMSVFSPKSIEDWVDYDRTALCPRCGIDSVLPGVDSVDFLAKANERWFTGREDETARGEK